MATNEIGIVSVVLFAVALLLVYGCERNRRDARDCVGRTAAAADGRLPAGATCPSSGAVFAVLKKDGRETVSCPDPRNHLAKPPRYERLEGKAWHLEQDLPAAPAAPPEVRRKATTLVASTNGTTSVVHVRPRFYWRWLVGPLIQLLTVIYIIALAVNLKPGDAAPAGVNLALLIFVISLMWMSVNALWTVEGSEVLEFDPVQRRLTERRFLFGVEREPVVFNHCEGFAFVRVKSGSWSLELISGAPNERTVTELVDGLSEGDAVLAAWLRSRSRP